MRHARSSALRPCHLTILRDPACGSRRRPSDKSSLRPMGAASSRRPSHTYAIRLCARWRRCSDRSALRLVGAASSPRPSLLTHPALRALKAVFGQIGAPTHASGVASRPSDLTRAGGGVRTNGRSGGGGRRLRARLGCWRAECSVSVPGGRALPLPVRAGAAAGRRAAWVDVPGPAFRFRRGLGAGQADIGEEAGVEGAEFAAGCGDAAHQTRCAPRAPAPRRASKGRRRARWRRKGRGAEV